MRTNSLKEICMLLEDAVPPMKRGKLWILRRDKVLGQVNEEIERNRLNWLITQERIKKEG